LVNLAQICERYGGGGHARVGAISFEPGETERAREAARVIVDELRESYRNSPKPAAPDKNRTKVSP
jgi:nanoRNase/pAp phosphatase (c-di-AMP/oligoRNAs hydrolase)